MGDLNGADAQLYKKGLDVASLLLTLTVFVFEKVGQRAQQVGSGRHPGGSSRSGPENVP